MVNPAVDRPVKPERLPVLLSVNVPVVVRVPDPEKVP